MSPLFRSGEVAYKKTHRLNVMQDTRENEGHSSDKCEASELQEMTMAQDSIKHCFGAQRNIPTKQELYS